MSELIIVGGPNGAGKTTFINGFLREEGHTYLGADLIAYEMCPEDLESVAARAGREFVKRVRECREGKEDVIVESTLSGKSLAKHIEAYRAAGYEVKMIFISLPNESVSAERVRIRVSKGGHHVPDKDIERRFLRTHWNFWYLYRELADEWAIYLNHRNLHELVAHGSDDEYHITRKREWKEMKWKFKN